MLWKFTEREAVNSGQVRKASARAGLWIGLSVGVDLWGWGIYNRSRVAQWFPQLDLLFVTVEADEPGLSILLESKQLSTLTASIRNACHNKQLLIRRHFYGVLGVTELYALMCLNYNCLPVMGVKYGVIKQMIPHSLISQLSLSTTFLQNYLNHRMRKTKFKGFYDAAS